MLPWLGNVRITILRYFPTINLWSLCKLRDTSLQSNVHCFISYLVNTLENSSLKKKYTANSAFLDQNSLLMLFYKSKIRMVNSKVALLSTHHKDCINRTSLHWSYMLETMHYLCFEAILFFLGMPGSFEHQHYAHF